MKKTARWLIKSLAKRNIKLMTMKKRMEIRSGHELEIIQPEPIPKSNISGDSSIYENWADEPRFDPASMGYLSRPHQPQSATQENDALQMVSLPDQNFSQYAKNRVRLIEKKALNKIESNQREEEFNLLNSKIDITGENVKTDLEMLTNFLVEEELRESQLVAHGSPINPLDYIANEESIIYEEEEGNKISNCDPEDSMNDIALINFDARDSRINMKKRTSRFSRLPMVFVETGGASSLYLSLSVYSLLVGIPLFGNLFIVNSVLCIVYL